MTDTAVDDGADHEIDLDVEGGEDSSDGLLSGATLPGFEAIDGLARNPLALDAEVADLLADTEAGLDLIIGHHDHGTAPGDASAESPSEMTEHKGMRVARRAPTGMMDRYLDDVSRYALATAAEEHALALRAREGDEDAINDLCHRNLRFVISVAKKYQNRGMDLSDLIAEGNVGLWTAAQKFNVDFGVKFISYAVWWIRQAILSALALQGQVVRLPLNRTSDLMRLVRAQEYLSERFGRSPTERELIVVTGLTLETVRALSGVNAPAVRLDATAGPDTDQTVGERLQLEARTSVEELVVRRLQKEEIALALHDLSDRDARVLRLYFGLDGEQEHTLEDIGRVLGITRERVRQLRDRALIRLRDGRRAEALSHFHH